MVLTQTRAILSYLAAKYNLHGKDLKETLRYQSVRAYTWFLAKLCGPAPTETQLRCSLSAWMEGRRQGNKGRCSCYNSMSCAYSEYLLQVSPSTLHHNLHSTFSYSLPTPNKDLHVCRWHPEPYDDGGAGCVLTPRGNRGKPGFNREES
eukprot:bmy_03091T0